MNKAKKQKKEASVNTEGLEKLFKPSTKDGITVDETTKELKLIEASQKYKVTERTILRWLKEGRLTGYKINGSHGMEWRITGESKEYIETQLIHDEHITMSPEDQLIITDDPGMTSKSVDSLITMVDKLSSKLESTQKELQAASFRNGWLEAQLSIREEQIKLLEDKQYKATEIINTPPLVEDKGWWKKFMSFLFTNNS